MSAMTNRLTSFIVARSSVRLTHQLSTAASARSTASDRKVMVAADQPQQQRYCGAQFEALDNSGVEATGSACGVQFCETSEGVGVTPQPDQQLSRLLRCW